MTGSDPTTLGSWEELILLAALHLGDRAYGAAIVREIEARTDRGASRSAIYVSLDRLESKGLIVSEPGDPTPDRGGRAPRMVRVTQDGVDALREARHLRLSLWRGLEEVFES